MTKQLLLILLLSVICFNESISSNSNDIQRVRIDFTSSQGYTRHLLLGFTPDNSASDNFDYGYDAPNIEDHPDDLNWIINDERYVIQGVGSFDHNKIYPLGMYLENDGSIEISLNALENFTDDIDVYIYDAETNSHHYINDSSLVMSLPSTDFEQRFYITFSNEAVPEQLSITESTIQSNKVYYTKYDSSIHIQSTDDNVIREVKGFNFLGQEVITLININSETVKIPIQNNGSNGLIIYIKTTVGVDIKKVIISS